MEIKTRQDIYALFGGVRGAVSALGISRQSLWGWGEKPPQRFIDRAVGAAIRLGLVDAKNGKLKERK